MILAPGSGGVNRSRRCVALACRGWMQARRYRAAGECSALTRRGM